MVHDDSYLHVAVILLTSTLYKMLDRLILYYLEYDGCYASDKNTIQI